MGIFRVKVYVIVVEVSNGVKLIIDMINIVIIGEEWIKSSVLVLDVKCIN